MRGPGTTSLYKPRLCLPIVPQFANTPQCNHIVFSFLQTMERWAGKVAVVTGASAGIGLAIARELVKFGVITVAVSRRPQLVEAIKPELSKKEADLLHAVKCDVSDECDVANLFEWIEKNLKAVHILVNNAGILTTGSLIDGPSENWRKTIDVNIMGLCLTTKAAFALMDKTGVIDGHIIHVNSVAGHKVPNVANLGFPVELNVYPATKHAVTALTETLRMEIQFKKLKTKVTSLSPGLVKTEIFKANGLEEKAGDIFSMPDANYIEPKCIADAAIYVLSTPPNVSISELTITPLGEIV